MVQIVPLYPDYIGRGAVCYITGLFQRQPESFAKYDLRTLPTAIIPMAVIVLLREIIYGWLLVRYR